MIAWGGLPAESMLYYARRRSSGMQSQEIEHYLAELGAALQSQGINKPVRLLLN